MKLIYRGDKTLKIVLGIFSRNDKILRISDTLKKLGHEVIVIFNDDYHSVCSYYEKKLDQLNIGNGRKNYREMIKAKFQRIKLEFEPDVMLFINLPKHILTYKETAAICQNCKSIVWFVDSLKGNIDNKEWYPVFDAIYVFEKSDTEYLKKQYGIVAAYCPVGFNAAYRQLKATDKPIDISFIGSPYKNRLELLEMVAKYAASQKLNMLVCGQFWENRYFWKKRILSKKYPHLIQYISNQEINSEEAAAIYTSSKICLNIHGSTHKNINPRTFEIMATGAFELMDEREDYADLIIPGKDLAVFRDKNDCVKKIDYYLKHNKERKQIALTGYLNIKDKLSMEKCLKKITTGGNNVER